MRADTSLDDTDTFGNDPGEPYLEVELDGETIVATRLLERSETFRGTVTIPESRLAGRDPGRYALTVQLWDQDGDRDDGDLGNDDLLDEWETTVEYTPPQRIEVQASRTQTVVGSPVTVRISDGESAAVRWSLETPSGSSADLHVSQQRAGVVTLRPDAAGTYRIQATPTGGGEGSSVQIDVQGGERIELLRQYAPRLYYHEDERYRPTRIEAFVHHSALEEFGEPNVETPTVFSIADKGDGWELDLQGSTDQFPTYDDVYPPTVYGSIHQNVRYRGESYTALTYWLFYMYDPKQTGSLSALFAHESDTETITILLDENGPQYVGASQHYGGEVREWSKTDRTGRHIHVYPALGAHSNYLVDSSQYDTGIPIQQQFVSETTQASLYAPAEDVYQDDTGSATVLTVGERPGDYELAVFTGTEIWASYGGVFGADDDIGVVPMQRSRWEAPGQWMEESLVPDEKQIDATGDISIRTADKTVTADLEVSNSGVKPHEFVAVLQVKPASRTWDSTATRTLDRASIPLGLDRSASRSLSGAAPSTPGEWDVRVRVLAYSPEQSTSEDVLVSRTRPGAVEVTQTPQDPTSTPSPTPTPSATRMTTTSVSESPTSESSATATARVSPTETPTDRGPGSGQKSESSVEPGEKAGPPGSGVALPGYRPITALLALGATLLLWRRRNQQ